MWSYLAVKHLHMTCAAVSGSLFVLRGIWKMQNSAMLARAWVRILPHVVDTILLASALSMVFWSGQYPFQQNWLTAKLLALLLYIGLGSLALKRATTKQGRALALAGAILVFGYIVAVAIRRQVLPF